MQGIPRRVAVTGAAGFIGRALCRALLDEGVAVVGVDLAPALDAVPAAADRRAADVTDPGAVAEAIADAEAVVHTAAIVSEWGRMTDFVAVNTRGTRNVLDAAESAGAARVVCLASVMAWGWDLRAPIEDEGTPPKPCGNPYVDTKGATETLALVRGATVIRPGDVYGPGSIPWVLRPLDGLRRGLLRLPGRGDGLLAPVYVDDLTDAILRALAAPEAAGRAYTVWSGEPVRAADFFAFHARWAGLERVPTLPVPLALAGAVAQEALARVTRRPPAGSRATVAYVRRRHVFPNARAREELGWEPRVSLEEGMRRTEEWLRAEGLVGG